MLDVALTVHGTIRELGVIMLRQDGAWRIGEIEYGPTIRWPLTTARIDGTLVFHHL